MSFILTFIVRINKNRKKYRLCIDIKKMNGYNKNCNRTNVLLVRLQFRGITTVFDEMKQAL